MFRFLRPPTPIQSIFSNGGSLIPMMLVVCSVAALIFMAIMLLYNP
jgi:hypothetical protein